ncbi:unnamed protein product [Knipowitschia caucasica]
MLSGTWRRSVGQSGPVSMGNSRGVTVCGVTGGTVVLEAQYDYNYRAADGRQVSIREGERFILLKKTNADWWQVRRIGAATKTKPLYVPATYVMEVPIQPLPSSQRQLPSASLNPNFRTLPRVAFTPSPTHSVYTERQVANKPMYRSMDNLSTSSAYQADGSSSSHFPSLPLSGFTFTPISCTSSSGHLMVPKSPTLSTFQPVSTNSRVIPTITRSQSSSNLPENVTENPYDEVGGGLGTRVACKPPKKSCSQWDMLGTSGKKTHLQVPTESYLAQLSWQVSPLYTDPQPEKRGSQQEPPSPAPGQQPLQILDLWEQHTDPASGRWYYVNSVTKERSWKPPRRARSHTTSSGTSSGTSNTRASLLHTQTLPRDTSHLKLTLPATGNGTAYNTLSSDHSHNKNTDSDYDIKQSLPRAASSDTLNNMTYSHSEYHNYNESKQMLSHSQSLILPENGKQSYVADIVVEPPSPASSPDSDFCTPELEKAGLLNKTKVAEGGRKLRKNWSLSWVVLVGNSLVFFKDPKSQTPSSWRPGNSRPESSVDLRGAQLHWANDLSSKKNVFKLRTVTGNEFLLQSDTDSLIKEWFKTIQSVIDRLDRENPMDNVLLYSLRRAGSVEMLEQSGDEDERKTSRVFPPSILASILCSIQPVYIFTQPPWQLIPPSVLSHLRRRPALPLFILTTIPSQLFFRPSCPTLTHSAVPLSSAVPRSSSNLENTERKRVKSRLKKLILKRPPLQALQEKGLIKDQVFGCRLEMLCERERNTVPRFVRLCTEAVERRGLDADGIYRVSGNLAVIQKLRFRVNHERAVTTDGRYMFPSEFVQEEKLDLDGSEWEDIHVITGSLKLFFRELPEPLVPFGFFTDIVETVKMTDYFDKVERLKVLLLNMPPPNHDTLLFMCRHLRRVLEHSNYNRMTTQNIGIVFGPTLMRPERDNGNIAINMVYQNQAVELILSEYEHIFGTRGFS